MRIDEPEGAPSWRIVFDASDLATLAPAASAITLYSPVLPTGVRAEGYRIDGSPSGIGLTFGWVTANDSGQLVANLTDNDRARLLVPIVVDGARLTCTVTLNAGTFGDLVPFCDGELIVEIDVSLHAFRTAYTAS